MKSADSRSNRSAASDTDLFTRADASSTLRLKSFMTVLNSCDPENSHAPVAAARLKYYFVLKCAGQGNAPGVVLYSFLVI
jgi:hypothetical protein